MKALLRRLFAQLEFGAGVSIGLALAAFAHIPFEGWSSRCAVCMGLALVNLVVLVGVVARRMA